MFLSRACFHVEKKGKKSCSIFHCESRSAYMSSDYLRHTVEAQ